MPKLKTNRLARKKFKLRANGRIKRGQANTSHNTGKQRPKRKRQLRKILSGVDGAGMDVIRGLLPEARRR